MIYTMTYTQQAPLIAHPVDKDGNPREVENLAFTTSDPAIATIEQLGVDGKPTDIEADRRPWVVATGVKGQVQVSASADRDMGVCAETIEESFTLAISDPKATSLGLGIGEAIEKQ